MRHVHRPARVCRPHIAVPARTNLRSPPVIGVPALAALLAFLIIDAAPVRAQVAFSLGYSWQSVRIGHFALPMRGTAGDLSIRVGKRVDVLVGVEQGNYASGDPQIPDKGLWSLRLGIHGRLLRSEGLDLGVAAGTGLYRADMDSEDLDGYGLGGFLQARLTLHPFPVMGVFAAGTVQTLGSAGRSGGSMSGVTLGLQLRSPGW